MASYTVGLGTVQHRLRLLHPADVHRLVQFSLVRQNIVTATA